MRTFGAEAYNFLISLKPEFPLPQEIDFLLPFQNDEARSLTREFYEKFYNDSDERIYIIGINPGRFGAGTTGIAFTDPLMLENECEIKNSLPKKFELSSQFIYEMIRSYGSVKSFYKRFFLTAVCPVGFVRNNKNLNYYDDKDLIKSSRKFIIESLNEQLRFGSDRKVAFCLGEGENFKFLKKVNDEFHFFEKIIPLAHPRFIMQYRRKAMKEYIEKYVEAFKQFS